MMLQRTAAEYCELTIAAFEREVAAGRICAPVLFGGKAHWHRASLDNDLARLAGLATDWRKDSRLYGEAA